MPEQPRVEQLAEALARVIAAPGNPLTAANRAGAMVRLAAVRWGMRPGTVVRLVAQEWDRQGIVRVPAELP